MDLGPIDLREYEEYAGKGRLLYLVFPSVVVRTGVLKDLGGLRAEFGTAADVDLWTRLAEAGPVLALPERLFGFRVHDQAASTRHSISAATANEKAIEKPTYPR